MLMKTAGLGALLIVVGAMFMAIPARAGGPCGDVLEKVCVGCHERDRFCERLGAPDKELRALIKRMVANGAELEKDDIALLAACLSEPAAAAKELCGK